jgi:predicted DNA-binding transcriptional regulator YafY
MATNKHARIRYQALDNCFSNPGRKYFIENLVAACNQAIYDFTGQKESVKKRQVYDDITFMESSQGWSIELERKKEGRNVYFHYSDKHYSINQSPLNQVELAQVKEVLLTLSRFRGMPQFEWVQDISSRLQGLSHGSITDVGKIIDFEQNQFLKGLELISDLFNAINNKRVLEIKYAPFKGIKEITYIFHPYYLKQYNLRWFLFGRSSDAKQLTNLALDRLVSIHEISDAYIQNVDVDFNEYFEDVIGVSVPLSAKVEKVILAVSNELWPYLATKPLHGSQKPGKETEGGQTIKLNLIVNYELISKLLSFGDGVKVLLPAHLAENIKERFKKCLQLYYTH